MVVESDMGVESDTPELSAPAERHRPTLPVHPDAPDEVDLGDGGPLYVVIVEDFWVDWQEAAPAQ